ncbi:universal stress protein [Solirhodobacter olei]|uniref:universal stress protein n=1 Tax=Solirhodobacter olei TaxID=2493082 RepID=UPI0013E30B08|nr:universal stress protein [Solirhodobacter olei]
MTLRQILVATDLSERSDRAVSRACLLARQTGAALHILHVVDEELPAPVAEADIAAAEAGLTELASAGRNFAGLDAKVEISPGDAWRTIVEKADYLDADLVVMGSHRQRGVAGMFEGTTLERVARVSRRAVLRVTARALGPYGRAVVGVDFSVCARQAARLAFELAPEGAVSLVHAYHVPYRALTMRTGPEGDLSKAEKDEIEAELAEPIATFVRETAPAGREVRSLVAEGAPDHVLRTQVAAMKADLLCLGYHARSWLRDAVLGSTAREMLADCPCDLLLAPAR